MSKMTEQEIESWFRELAESNERARQAREAKARTRFEPQGATPEDAQEFTSDVMHAAARIRTWAKGAARLVTFEVRGWTFQVDTSSGIVYHEGKPRGYTPGLIRAEPQRPAEVRTVQELGA